MLVICMLGFEKKLLRNMFFQCHLRTEKWSDFYHIYNKYEIWGLPLVRKGPEPMPPPPTHTRNIPTQWHWTWWDLVGLHSRRHWWSWESDRLSWRSEAVFGLMKAVLYLELPQQICVMTKLLYWSTATKRHFILNAGKTCLVYKFWHKVT